MRIFPLLVLSLGIFLSFPSCRFAAKGVRFNPKEETVYPRLSDYGIFSGDLSDLRPQEGMIPYDLSTPLFSDYAAKHRMVYLPPGTRAKFNDTAAFEFPVGTLIAKTFFYYHDPKNPDKGKRIIETRLLLHRESGWEGLPYIWNEDQTEAFLSVAGGRTHLEALDESGSALNFEYSVPSKPQCKACHDKYGKTGPIGPKALVLNKDFPYPEGTNNQLAHWASLGVLEGLPSGNLPPSPVWNNPQSADLDSRARAYLDLNCAHCHNPGGAGGSSGLDLRFSQRDPSKFGVCKMPVAAGKGSGKLLYSILPASPDSSILLYRMNSTQLNEMMPELGRKLVHKEGVALVREWIRSLPGTCP